MTATLTDLLQASIAEVKARKKREAMKRTVLRESNGRYRQPSLERDFGLRTTICPHCRGFNAYQRNAADPFQWDEPTVCGQCGKSLKDEEPREIPKAVNYIETCQCGGMGCCFCEPY